jgi:hypothetical protein
MTVENLHPGTAEILREIFINKNLSWPDNHRVPDNFVEDIIAHGMAPILWNRLGGMKNTSDWPPEIQSQLRHITLHETAQELRLQVEITSLLKAFAAADLKPLLIKGTPLSYTLYPAPGMRPRCDTDILIPASAREKTAEIMKQQGYAAIHDAAVDFINSQMCYEKKRPSNQYFNCDIHWQVSNNDREFSRRFNYDSLAANAVNIPELGDNAWTLNAVDALILACVHRAGHLPHNGDRLIWLYDIHLLTEVLSDEDSVLFYNKVQDLAVVGLCIDGITAARSRFGSTLTASLQSLLEKDPGGEPSSAFLQPGRLNGIRNRALRDLKSMSNRKDRLQYLLQNAFPPAEYMFWRYNTKQKALLPWLYVKRIAHAAFIFLR